MFDSDIAEEDIAEILTLLAQKGETAEEIQGALRALKERCTPINAPVGVMDCCGTGGTGLDLLNISTAAAFVIAGCGVPVAKHGNRAATSKSGSADVLEALGISLDLPAEKTAQALEEIGFAFLMAPMHHRVMGRVAPVRKKLGFRTIFNLLGPLANPAGARHQLIGVFDPHWSPILAEVLKYEGMEAAWIAHGHSGMAEISTTGPTEIVSLERTGLIESKILSPDDFDVQSADISALKGGDATYNAVALRALLDGQASAYRDIVCVNAAAALVIAGKATALREATYMAMDALDSGAAQNVFERYKTFSTAATS